jgi:hypothetical protein
MPTIPTGKLEAKLRALYLQWLAGVPAHQDNLQQYIDEFQRKSQMLIVREGGRVAMMGAVADFPVPKLLELSPTAGVVYSEMRQAAIQAGIMAGLNSKDVARQMLNAGFDKSYRRLERLARTETTNAYWKNAFASTADLPLIVMVWGSESSKKTCDYCQSRDGLVIEDSNIRDHPNGRCTPIPTLRTRVNYKGTLQPDGSVYMDPAWSKNPAAAKLTPEELTTKPMADLEKILPEKQAAINDYAREWAKAHDNSRAGILDDIEFKALRAELDAIYKQMSIMKAAADKAKRLEKVGHHPKVDKLPTMPKPFVMEEAYSGGVANPNGRGFTLPNGKVNGVTGSLAGDYQINCTRVAWAVEMRMRGYDVKAAAAGDGTNKSDAWITANWVDPNTGTKRNLKKSATEAQMIRDMEKQPEGSRFFVIAPWKRGGAHIWNAEIRGGKLIFHEGQVQNHDAGTERFTKNRFTMMDFEKWKGTTAQPRWMRVDDLEPTDMGVTRKWNDK